eukprot:COSAG06_NODE_54014_length_296_cov_133.426396_1_plen_39_part_10
MVRSIPVGWGCIASAPPLLIGEAQSRSAVTGECEQTLAG